MAIPPARKQRPCGGESATRRKKNKGQGHFELAFQPPLCIFGRVECLLRYRGKDITAQEVEFIKNFILEHPTLSRRRLSTELCRVWNWAQANGRLRSMVCRGMMLALHRAGHIQLPPVRHQPPNPLAQRPKPAPLLPMAWEPIQAAVRELGALEIRQVRRTAQEPLFGSLMEAHHYLAYSQPVGEHLKHLVSAQGTPIACLAWSSAPRHLGSRDRFIGWTAQERRAGIHFLSYNTRSLLLPWTSLPGLASHVLSQAARVVSEDWQRLYHHPVYLLEPLSIRNDSAEPVIGRPIGGW